MAAHPELDAEQAYIDHAYDCLEATRVAAKKMRTMVEVGRGGTEQARFERDVIQEAVLSRLAQLDVGDAALCFGRIDLADPDRGSGSADDLDGHRAGGGERYYIGRVAVSDERHEPVVVDWRAPVAEPFYRATGRQPMGLVRRRHFATKGRTLLGVEDELFGEAVLALDDGAASSVAGHGALIAALEANRSGRLSDIVATIQGEQDEVIRSPMPGVLIVQGGPGSGKTVVALHRAAYLLYTHRFPLEGQGVLVIGPNRLFLGYIEQVLPSLGEAGVELAVLADLVPGARFDGYDRGTAARVKGDLRMGKLLARAVRDRERPLREDLVIGYGLQTLTFAATESKRVVDEARRRFRRHNAARRFVEAELFSVLARSGRGNLSGATVRERMRRHPEVREALEWMWPVLTPADLLHDLFGSRALLRSAGRGLLSPEEIDALERPRLHHGTRATFSHDDAPLLDEAAVLLGRDPRRKRSEGEDEPRTYGHIVVDEAQDLSPMQLRMVARRSLNGSMTVVGDIAQATGEWAHESWESIEAHLPDRRPAVRAELTIGYRLPAPIMDLAARVLRQAAPWLTPPTPVREDAEAPTILQAPSQGELANAVARQVQVELAAVDPGHVAVVCPWSLVPEVSASLTAAGVPHGQATRHGLDQQVTVVPVNLVKGLEVDSAVVVEPSAIVEGEPQGLRSLYVALTRATKRLAIVHSEPLPAALR